MIALGAAPRLLVCNCKIKVLIQVFAARNLRAAALLSASRAKGGQRLVNRCELDHWLLGNFIVCSESQIFASNGRAGREKSGPINHVGGVPQVPRNVKLPFLSRS